MEPGEDPVLSTMVGTIALPDTVAVVVTEALKFCPSGNVESCWGAELFTIESEHLLEGFAWLVLCIILASWF